CDGPMALFLLLLGVMTHSSLRSRFCTGLLLASVTSLWLAPSARADYKWRVAVRQNVKNHPKLMAKSMAEMGPALQRAYAREIKRHEELQAAKTPFQRLMVKAKYLFPLGGPRPSITFKGPDERPPAWALPDFRY